MEPVELPKSVSDLITKKCGSIVSLKITWERSLRKLIQNGGSISAVVKLASALNSPAGVDALSSSLAVHGESVETFLTNLHRLVNETDFDFASWMRAIETVLLFLAKEGRVVSSDSILGYVHCSAEFAASSANHEPLDQIVGGMLKQYGFDGQDGCAT